MVRPAKAARGGQSTGGEPELDSRGCPTDPRAAWGSACESPSLPCVPGFCEFGFLSFCEGGIWRGGNYDPPKSCFGAGGQGSGTAGSAEIGTGGMAGPGQAGTGGSI